MSDEGPLVFFDDFKLNRKRCELSRAGQTIPLRPKTLAVLIYLIENADRVVSKQELLEAVWPGLRIETQGVYQSIAELRAVFGGRNFIRTVRRTGYQWTAELGHAPRRSARYPAVRRKLVRVITRPAVAIGASLLVALVLIAPKLQWLDGTPSAGDPEVLVERARAHYADGEFDVAGDILSMAVAGNPRHLAARLGLAQVRVAQGNERGALEIAQELYRDAAGMGAPQIRIESAILLSDLRTGHDGRAEARAYAREAVELATRFHNPVLAGAAHERLGDIYLAEGRRSLAEIELSMAARQYRGHCPSGEKRVDTKLELISGRT